MTEQEKLRLQSKADARWKRVDELGSEYRRIALTIAGGVFFGGLFRSDSPLEANITIGVLAVGLAAFILLANTLRSKRRSTIERDLLLSKIGESDKISHGGVKTTELDELVFVVLVGGVVQVVLGNALYSIMAVVLAMIFLKVSARYE